MRTIDRELPPETVRIRDLRAQTKKTQAEFAKWMKMPVTTVRKWETGEHTPPEYVINMIEVIVTCPEARKAFNVIKRKKR